MKSALWKVLWLESIPSFIKFLNCYCDIMWRCLGDLTIDTNLFKTFATTTILHGILWLVACYFHINPYFFLNYSQSTTNSCGKNCGVFFFFFFLMWFYNFCLLRWQAIKWTISLSRGCIIYSMHQIKITVVKILFHWIYFFSKWRRSLMQSNPMHLWFGILFLDISWA